MKQGIVAMTLTGLLALPTALSAQEHQQHHRQGQQERPQQETMQQRQGMMGMGQDGMMGMMGMMSGHGPQFVLRQKEALNLDESQVQRLEALQKQLADAREARMKEVEPLRRQVMEALHAEKPDLGAYESALKKLAEHHVKMQVDAARISGQALDVLTPEQRSNVHYAMRLMRGMMGGGMMMQGGMMRGGMMGDAGMMEAAR